ncbi:MAG: peptide ABC transporter substrate-binding protein [Patescibacteria group bacterium]
MFDRATRLRIRRSFKRSRRQVEDIGYQAEEQLERHVIRRINKFGSVWRFVASWLILCGLAITLGVYQIRGLSVYYQTTQPISGGTFTEGIIGTFTNVNPLYAAGAVDTSVSRLVFSGLLRYDQKNRLAGDLAEGWKADESGRIYTVTLRDKLRWHDGQPLTSDDVLFTYQTIQNPDAKSPLLSSWAGIKVEAISAREIRFSLPNGLASFPYSLTTGIVPKHKLKNIPVAELRSIRFNTADPIGAGPYKWEAIEVVGDNAAEREERIALLPNEYYQLGKPKLQRFVVRTFREEKKLLEAFESRELTAMAGLESVPDNIENQTGVITHSITTTNQVNVFLRLSSGPLADVKVRQALTMATSLGEVVADLGYPVVTSRSPLLDGQPGYDRTLLQLSFDQVAANKLLDEAGWTKGADGIRTKDNQKLQFKLFSQSTSDYRAIAAKLQQQWSKIGADAGVELQEDADLQNTITYHTYDALLYGISIGVDPDVFVYWHSSQADPRLTSRTNFSEYKSTVADKALEEGRTRTQAQLRAIKYRPFLEAWRQDAPAISLYQPRLIWVSRGEVHQFNLQVINGASDRYNNVHNWMIREAKVTNQN